MAPLEAAPAIVSKDRSFNAPVSSRNASNLETASISSGGLIWPSVAIQWRKRVSATPSRAWARLVPSISTEFLQALGSAQGSSPRITSAPAPASASKYHDDETDGSTTTALPLSSARAAGRSDGLSNRTSFPSQVGRSGVILEIGR